MSQKEELLHDIEKLLNSFDDKNTTSINPQMLQFMDEASLKSIINSILNSREHLSENTKEWLETFKKYN